MMPIFRLRFIVKHGVKAGQTHRHTDRKQQAEKPAEFRQIKQCPLIHQNSRSYAETDKVRQGIQLGTEFGRTFQHPGNTAVQAVKQSCKKDADNRFNPILLHGIANGSYTGTQSQHGDNIRSDFAKRQTTAEPRFRRQGFRRCLFHYLTTPLTCAASLFKWAITLSPAIIVWPRQTCGSTPSGR